MKPKQPKPKAVKMWAVWEPHFEYFVLFFEKRKAARDCCKNEEKVIRVTVTPEPPKKKARDK